MSVEQPVRNLGWQVTFAGLGINLALGILYTWSVISGKIPDSWHWGEADRSWPYAIACLVFSLVMIPAGRLQDRFGPRVVASVGGLLVGLGMILASLTTSFVIFAVAFGVLAGAGIGCGYAAATPPAVKWFSAKRTGMIAGIVVSGFGLASVYAAPLTSFLIESFGVSRTMLILGIAFTVVVVGLAQLLVPPPAGYVPAGANPAKGTPAAGAKRGVSALGMLGTVPFYLLWFLYFCGAGAGLMFISKIKIIGHIQADITNAFILVAACAVGNGAGRIVAGTLSDKLGRQATLFGAFVFQAVLMLLLSVATGDSSLTALPVMLLISALIGANYGANLSLFPSITKDYYGLKNFGINYGILFTAWGIGGFLLPLMAGTIFDAAKRLDPGQVGNFTYAYYVAAVLLVIAAALTFTVKAPKSA